MTTRIIRMLFAFLLGFALAGSFLAIQKAHSDYAHPLVSMLERKFQVYPGQTRVWPECGCTIRYVGTTVRGGRYNIVFDKLD